MSDEKSKELDAPKEVPKEKFSTPNNIQLMEFKPEYFGGIRPDMNFVFHLSDGPVAQFKGDQGLCKTSLLNCMIFLLGGDEAVNSIHRSLKDMKELKQKAASITFKDLRNPNTTYEVRVTKTMYSVKKIELTDGSPVTSLVQSPKDFIRNLFGPIGVSPMILKEKDGKAQIEWLRSLFRLTAEQLKMETDIKEKLKAKFTLRTAVNNSIKSLYKEVADTPYYEWDKHNTCFIPTLKRNVDLNNIKENLKSEQEIKEKMQIAQDRLREKDKYQNAADQLKIDKTNLENEIEDLQKKLELKKDDLLKLESRIEKGTEILTKYETAQDDFEKVQKQMLDIGDLKVTKTKVEDADLKATSYDSKVAEKINIVSSIDDLKTLMKKFVETFTPKIEGLKIVVNDGLDKSDDENTAASQNEVVLPEGMYYNDRSMAELSESEIWSLWALISRSLNIRFLFIENGQNLGTAAAETINNFIKDGHGCVYYTTMLRGQKELQFTINGEFN